MVFNVNVIGKLGTTQPSGIEHPVRNQDPVRNPVLNRVNTIVIIALDAGSYDRLANTVPFGSDAL